MFNQSKSLAIMRPAKKKEEQDSEIQHEKSPNHHREIQLHLHDAGDRHFK